MSKLISFTTKISEEEAGIFDKIAEKNLRSRASHLEYIVKKEIQENAVAVGENK